MKPYFFEVYLILPAVLPAGMYRNVEDIQGLPLDY